MMFKSRLGEFGNEITFDSWDDFENNELIFQMVLNGIIEPANTTFIAIPEHLHTLKKNKDLDKIERSFKKKYNIPIYFYRGFTIIL